MYIKNNKTTIYLNIDKKISKTPYLFIHGFTNSYKTWGAIRKELGSNTIAIDIPGHGNSTFNNLNETYTYNDWVNEFYLSLKHLDIKKINLCGYSMGGRLALVFAIKYPNLINKLILESTSLGIEDYQSKEERLNDDTSLSDKIKDSFDLFLSDWGNNSLFKNQKKRNKIEFLKQQKIRSLHNPNQLSKALDSFTISKLEYLYDYYTRLNFPITIINGNDDDKYVKKGKDMVRWNKNAYQYIVNNASHNVHLERFNEYANILQYRNLDTII